MTRKAVVLLSKPTHKRPYFSCLKHYCAFTEDLLYTQNCTCPTRVDDKEKWYPPSHNQTRES